MEPLKTLEDRVRRIFREKNLSYAEASRMFGISKAAVTLWGHGGKIRWTNLKKIIDKYPDISLEWLIRGNGLIYLGEKGESINALKDIIVKQEKMIDTLQRALDRLTVSN